MYVVLNISGLPSLPGRKVIMQREIKICDAKIKKRSLEKLRQID